MKKIIFAAAMLVLAARAGAETTYMVAVSADIVEISADADQ